MSYRLPRDFGDRFTEIFTSYQLSVEDEHPDALLKITHLNQVLEFLTWARKNESDVGDILSDTESRDRAAGFYKRALFQRGFTPNRINAALGSLSRFYVWWGLGPHTVPLLTLEPPATPAGHEPDRDISAADFADPVDGPESGPAGECPPPEPPA